MPRDTHLRYEWSSAYALERGFPRTPQSAAMVAAELRRIQGNAPVLEPTAVVEAARPDDAELHPAFTWNDAVAAERWRERQAQDLQRGVRVVMVRKLEDGTERHSAPVAVFASIKPEAEPRGYRETLVSLQEPSHRAVLLREAVRELRLFRARYKALLELAGVMASIDVLLERERAAAGELLEV
jgi:hypothetical protein